MIFVIYTYIHTYIEYTYLKFLTDQNSIIKYDYLLVNISENIMLSFLSTTTDWLVKCNFLYCFRLYIHTYMIYLQVIYIFFISVFIHTRRNISNIYMSRKPKYWSIRRYFIVKFHFNVQGMPLDIIMRVLRPSSVKSPDESAYWC